MKRITATKTTKTTAAITAFMALAFAFSSPVIFADAIEDENAALRAQIAELEAKVRSTRSTSAAIARQIDTKTKQIKRLGGTPDKLKIPTPTKTAPRSNSTDTEEAADTVPTHEIVIEMRKKYIAQLKTARITAIRAGDLKAADAIQGEIDLMKGD